MEDLTPRLIRQDGPDGPCAVLRGSWTAAQLTAPGVWRRTEAALRAPAAGQAPGWDLRGLQRLDHLGALLLWHHWGHQWPAQLQVHEDQRAVLARVAGLSGRPPLAGRATPGRAFLALGAWVVDGLRQVRDVVRMIGQLMLDLARLLRAPRKAPWRDLSGQLFHVGATALPITAMVGFLIGVVLAYLTAQQLRQFGAETFIVNILGLSLIRELGPVLAAVLIAGRSGSAITAQIGVMRVTEELDAMRVMGIPSSYRLVLPRALALAVAMPLLTVWTTLAALAGGMLSADLALGVTPAYFLAALPDAVPVANLALAMGKAALFGVLIALIGCHHGLRVQPDTESLGRSTTASVVSSITVVILVDALFAVVFKNVGV